MASVSAQKIKSAAAVPATPRSPKHQSSGFDEEGVDTIPMLVQFTTMLSYALLIIWGYVREFYRRLVPQKGRETPAGFAPLVKDFDDFFTRRMYYRARDCWNRPVDTRAGRVIGVMDRVSPDHNKTFEFVGTSTPCINLASYNYLGFAEDMASITVDNLEAVQACGIAGCASALEGGNSSTMRSLEVEIARHVGKEAACVYAMGFVTNFSGLPSLFDKTTLVVSDSLNHASLVAGVRLSSGRVKVFPHNDTEKLEEVIRHAIVDGQPRTHKDWSRIVIVVEGVYSMEGEILDLPAIVAIKKKYNCLLYVDEAHSIGALGATGRGVCEHFGIDPADVDVLMGTFTKSFGSIGGYIASNADLINYVKKRSGASLMGDTLHSAAAQQALSSLRVLQGKDGTTAGKDKVRQLADNARYMRQGLTELGVRVLGQEDSPVIPMMLYNPAKCPFFSRECLKRNLAVVVVGYPATPLLESRVRFCVSASHTKADLDRALATISEVVDLMPVRYASPKCHLWA